MSFELGMGMEEHDSQKVEIVLKTIGPARPSRLLVPSSVKVRDLRRLIAGNDNLPIDNLSLILRGSALCDMKNGDDVYVQLNDGDCLIVAVKPKPPVKDGYDNDDDDEDLKFRLPHSSSWWKKRLYSFLRDNLKLPDILLMVIFTLSLKAWVLIILWFILAPVAHRWDLGPLYILATGFCLILSILESAKLVTSAHILSSMKTLESFQGRLMQIVLIEI
ncbi:Ubiquitin supergroup [Spatholobus suberectus]|nr:Ubiquitin supergroup [Spatholobus suberectus]